MNGHNGHRWPPRLPYFTEVIDWLEMRIRKCRKHIQRARIQNRNVVRMELSQRLKELRDDLRTWKWDRDVFVAEFLEEQRGVA